MNEVSIPLIRPNEPGFFWCLRGGSGNRWHIVEAKMIQWGDDDDNYERVLAASAGGCWTRCDYINKNHDDGTRYYRAHPPATARQPDAPSLPAAPDSLEVAPPRIELGSSV